MQRARESLVVLRWLKTHASGTNVYSTSEALSKSALTASDCTHLHSDTSLYRSLTSSPFLYSPKLIKQTVGLTEVSAAISQQGLTWENRNITDDLVDPDTTSSLSGVGLNREGANYFAQPVRSLLRHIKGHAQSNFQALFLPTGYPLTVKPNYERYIKMQAFQNTVASTNAIVSSTFLLYAVGMGYGAIPVAGALNWVLKDGVGQMGTLLFGRVIAHDFDINTRTWHFWSACTINLASAAEIMTIWFPGYFLLLGSFANMLKGLSWMAGGSTRAAFNVSFAKGENIADITAKGTSQYICTSLLGTGLGIVVCSVVQNDAGLALCCSAMLGCLNLLTTWATIRAVPLATLNHTRMQLLMAEYQQLKDGNSRRGPAVLSTPSQLCCKDPVVHLPVLSLDPRFEPSVEVGTPLCDLLDPMISSSQEKLQHLVEIHKSAHHLLLRDGRQRTSRLHIVLHTDATPADCVAAMLHAVLLRREVLLHDSNSIDLQEEKKLLKLTLNQADSYKHDLLSSMRSAGWNMDRVCIETRLYRATW